MAHFAVLVLWTCLSFYPTDVAYLFQLNQNSGDATPGAKSEKVKQIDQRSLAFTRYRIFKICQMYLESIKKFNRGQLFLILFKIILLLCWQQAELIGNKAFKYRNLCKITWKLSEFTAFFLHIEAGHYCRLQHKRKVCGPD